MPRPSTPYSSPHASTQTSPNPLEPFFSAQHDKNLSARGAHRKRKRGGGERGAWKKREQRQASSVCLRRLLAACSPRPTPTAYWVNGQLSPADKLACAGCLAQRSRSSLVAMLTPTQTPTQAVLLKTAAAVARRSRSLAELRSVGPGSSTNRPLPLSHHPPTSTRTPTPVPHPHTSHDITNRPEGSSSSGAKRFSPLPRHVLFAQE